VYGKVRLLNHRRRIETNNEQLLSAGRNARCPNLHLAVFTEIPKTANNFKAPLMVFKI
jgi:hypothetical protein